MNNQGRVFFPIVFIGILLLIIGIFAIPKLRKMKAENNERTGSAYLRSLGIAMCEFDSMYGDYPSQETKELLQDEGLKLRDGDTANAYLAQLLAAEVLDSEKIFYIPGLANTKEGDNVFDTPDTVLARGENGCGYVLRLETGLTASYGSSREPLLVVPVIEGGANPKFDRRPFQGSGLILHRDTSVGSYPINHHEELIAPKTEKNLFAPGEDTIWGPSTTVDVKVPWFLD